MRYDPSVIEPRWQKAWQEQRVFEVPRDVKSLEGKPKFYVLDMFPYPSGAGLHVGHPEGYTATDILSRIKRMRGYAVLHPMGWDAFGLPAERSAVRENIHPAVITKRNIENFRGQLQRIGFSYDWSREVSTTDEKYYRWTQWIFLKLHERGLAYMAEVPVNWCPALGTVLANEEVKDGKYVETGDPVERRSMKQWMLKITEYGDRLLEDLDTLDWPESIKEMQRNWIGKSEGAEVRFHVAASSRSEGQSDESFIIFTTRPDTLFGATYCVLAPEHPLVGKVTTTEQSAAVNAYVTEAKQKTDLARTDLAKDKSGVFTGAYAVNPVNDEKVPIWVADYVLMTYGTGAIMAVPGHDERDHEFAKKFGLPIVEVVTGSSKPIDEEAYTGDGTLVNSPLIDGLPVPEAKSKITSWLEDKKKGERKIQYRLRDWLFSRQRYWGEPFPVIHLEDGTVLPVSEKDLPVTLPPVDEYKPTDDGRPPLARAPKEWLEVTLPDGRKGTRETNTMPQWAGSCWYYLRFIDPDNEQEPWDRAAEKYWMPVDLYVGGVEHAVLHLLYARFWHKVLFDCGLVSTKEPFQRLFNQGMILAFSYQDEGGKYYSADDVEERDGKILAKSSGKELKSQIEKMSKSKYNVYNPDDVIKDYGADALRLYEMFMGPLEQVKPWQMAGVEGVSRFLHRVWRLIVDERSNEPSPKLTDADAASEPELNRELHRTIKKVLEDSEGMRFNTAISQMMSFVNDATAAKTLPKGILKDFLKVLSPYAPHLAEELWHRLGEERLLALAEWPAHDEALTLEDTVTIALQVNGKRRDEIQVARGASKEDVEKAALANEQVQRHLEGKPPKKVIVVPGRLVNVVA